MNLEESGEWRNTVEEIWTKASIRVPWNELRDREGDKKAFRIFKTQVRQGSQGVKNRIDLWRGCPLISWSLLTAYSWALGSLTVSLANWFPIRDCFERVERELKELYPTSDNQELVALVDDSSFTVAHPALLNPQVDMETLLKAVQKAYINFFGLPDFGRKTYRGGNPLEDKLQALELRKDGCTPGEIVDIISERYPNQPRESSQISRLLSDARRILRGIEDMAERRSADLQN
jgi:hypothetical protein